MGLWCPVCAVAAFYRGPEVGQAKLELVGGLPGGRHSLSVSTSLVSACMDKRKRASKWERQQQKVSSSFWLRGPCVLIIRSRLQEARKTPSAQVEPCCRPASQDPEGFWSSVLCRRCGGAWNGFGNLTGVMGWHAAQWWDWLETTLEHGGSKLGTPELDGRRSPFLLPAEQFHCCLLPDSPCDSFS